jgi:hypothetical protein
VTGGAPRVLTLLPDRLAICRFAPEEPPPAWVFHAESRFYSVTRTVDELSVVTAEDDLPPAAWDRARRGWRAFRLEGPVPFELTGVIAGLTAPLAAAGVPVFVLSTWDTDLVLVEEERLAAARAALAAAGYEVRG